MIESIDHYRKLWKDTPESHRYFNEHFIEHVNATPELKELRDWVESNIWGFGERSFYWMWKLLVDEMPANFTFLEIGVFRGQILALINLLARTANKDVKVLGISPLDTTGEYWESDYEKDVAAIHRKIGMELGNYLILKGYSSDENVFKAIRDTKVDLLYIDGGHEYNTVFNDIKQYSPLIKPGGYLVIDDSCVSFNLPDGYFRGHQEVSQAVDELLPPAAQNKDFEFLFSVVHNRVFKKI